MVRIMVQAKANAKKESIVLLTQPTLDLPGSTKTMDVYKITVCEPSVNNMANNAIIRVLAEYFCVAKSCVSLVSGATAKKKVFEVLL
ncbi:MAG: DUF167 domain-containing protein [bacterium]